MELFCRVGNVYLRTRRAGEAARFFRAALVAAINGGNRIAQGYVMLQLAHCDLETNRDAATRNYQSARDLFSSLGYAPGTAYAELCLGIAYQRAAQFPEAYKHLDAALVQYAAVLAQREEDGLFADCERAFLGTSRSPAFDAMIELLLQTGKQEEAFGMVERRTSELLLDVLDAYRPAPSDEALSGALNRYFEVRGERIGAEKLLARSLTASTQQKELITTLRAALDTTGDRITEAAESVVRLNRLYEPVVRGGAVTFAPVQKALSPGVALLEFVPTRRSLYLYVITSTGVSVHMSAVGSDSLIAQSNRLLSLFQRRELRIDTTLTAIRQLEGRIEALSSTLFSAYVRPVESALSGCPKVIAVIAGDLPSIPLHALRRSSGSPYVIERYLVTYLPSVRALFMNSSPPSRVQQVVGVGHPGSTDWDVEYELRDIRAFYKDAKLFFGQQASLSTLQTESGDLLHLAADFRFNVRFPVQSSVTLSDGTTLTGVRRVALGELFSLAPFPTVVVSDLAPDQRSIPSPVPCIFLANKAAAVILSPYAPSRKVKKVFGETFYTALQQGDAAPAAYWRSQLEMMKKPEASSAADWGSYFLWGR